VCRFVFPRSALAWGDEGHEIIALVADRFLDPAVREKIAAMIAADTDKQPPTTAPAPPPGRIGIAIPTATERFSPMLEKRRLVGDSASR